MIQYLNKNQIDTSTASGFAMTIQKTQTTLKMRKPLQNDFYNNESFRNSNKKKRKSKFACSCFKITCAYIFTKRNDEITTFSCTQNSGTFEGN